MTFLLSCALWGSIYNQRNSIRVLIQSTSQAKYRYKVKNTLICFIISVSVYWSAFMASSVITTSCELKRSFVRSDINVSFLDGNISSFMNMECKWIRITQEILSHLQQLLMPFLFAILFYSICFNVITIRDYYKTKFVLLKGSCNSQILRAFLKEYVDIMKYAETFSETFSLPLFWFVWNVMCTYRWHF